MKVVHCICLGCDCPRASSSFVPCALILSGLNFDAFPRCLIILHRWCCRFFHLGHDVYMYVRFVGCLTFFFWHHVWQSLPFQLANSIFITAVILSKLSLSSGGAEDGKCSSFVCNSLIIKIMLTQRVSFWLLGVVYRSMPVASQSLLICNGCCFVHELVKTFHLAFFLGCLGVALLWLNPISAASSLNSFELNGGPSLGCTVCGTSCVVKIFFSFFRTGLIYIALMIQLLGILSIGLLR